MDTRCAKRGRRACTARCGHAPLAHRYRNMAKVCKNKKSRAHSGTRAGLCQQHIVFSGYGRINRMGNPLAPSLENPRQASPLIFFCVLLLHNNNPNSHVWQKNRARVRGAVNLQESNGIMSPCCCGYTYKHMYIHTHIQYIRDD